MQGESGHTLSGAGAGILLGVVLALLAGVSVDTAECWLLAVGLSGCWAVGCVGGGGSMRWMGDGHG